jgi:hypothetical protein
MVGTVAFFQTDPRHYPRAGRRQQCYARPGEPGSIDISVRAALCILILVSGLAGLSWETLWQLQAALSLGVSARGTALTLVGTMGGMSVGAALAGRLLDNAHLPPAAARLRRAGVAHRPVGFGRAARLSRGRDAEQSGVDARARALAPCFT